MTEPFLPIELLLFNSATTTIEAIALANGLARDLQIRNTFSSFLKKMTVQAKGNTVVLVLVTEVLDRDDGTPRPLYFTRQIDVILGTVEVKYVVYQIVDFLHWTVQHEIDECITIKGVRVNDPHRNQSTVEHTA